jgi:hypothetical protein
MDIRLVITSVGLFVATYALTLGIPFWLYYQGRHFFAVVAAGLLASASPIVYSRLRQRAEARLLEMERAYQRKLLEVAEGLGEFKTVEAIAGALVSALTETMALSRVVFYRFVDGNLVRLRGSDAFPETMPVRPDQIDIFATSLPFVVESASGAVNLPPNNNAVILSEAKDLSGDSSHAQNDSGPSFARTGDGCLVTCDYAPNTGASQRLASASGMAFRRA